MFYHAVMCDPAVYLSVLQVFASEYDYKVRNTAVRRLLGISSHTVPASEEVDAFVLQQYPSVSR